MQRYACPQGHQWEVPATCPHCGSPVTAVTHVPAAEPATLAPSQPVDTNGAPSPAPPAPEAATLAPVSSGPAAPAPELDRATVSGYEILGELGRGGMGVVYKARQLGLNRLVALKMILVGGHAGEAERTRFRLEAEAVARLQHPNIVQVFDTGESHGHPYFSLEFVGGGTLATRLDHRPQPARQAAQLTAVLARAVHAAHQCGIIHRDLKPSNILLTPDGTPKVTDFGLAKRLDAEGHLTQSNAILGTPSYMAPEQAECRPRSVGPAADIYALGAMLYEMLTGRPPFLAETPLDTILQVVTDPPVPPSRLQPRVPADLEAICLKCLDKQPHRRYHSARALADDLDRFLAGLPTEAGQLRARSWTRRNAGQLAAVGVWALGAALLAAPWPPRPVVYALVGGVFLPFGLRLWRRAAGKSLDVLRGHRGKVYGLGFSPDGKYLASASADRTVGLWEPARGQKWATLQGHRGAVYAVAFSPDGRTLASAGADRTVRFWNPVTGEASPTTLVERAGTCALAFAPDARTLAVGCGDGAVGLWDVATGERRTILRPARGRRRAVYALAYSPDGQLLACGHTNGKATLWDVGRARERAGLNEHGRRHFFLWTARSPAVGFAPDGKVLATGRTEDKERPVRLYNTLTGQSIRSLEDPRGWMPAPRRYRTVYSLAFSADGKVLTAAHGKVVKVWDLNTAELRHRFTGHRGQVYAVAVSPDGQTVASGGADRTVRLWDPTAPPRARPKGWWQRLSSWVGRARTGFRP
jgi:hypothetical protein